MECSGTNRRPVQSEARCQWIAEVVGIEFDSTSTLSRNVKGCFFFTPLRGFTNHKVMGYSEGNDASNNAQTFSACFNEFEWEAQVRDSTF